MKDPRFENATMREVRRRLQRHHGDANPGEPDCMYWLKHIEAGFIIAALGHEKERDAYDSRTQKVFARLQQKVAKQWIKYDRFEERKNK